MKRRLLMATQAAQACTALAVAHVGILALCSGLANTLFNVVKQSFVIETVGGDDVGNAVALSSAAFNGARIVGPAAAGLVIAGVGVATAFAVSGAGHLLVLATLATIGVEGRPRRQRTTTIRQDIVEGAVYALRTPEIRAVLAVLFVISFCTFNFSMWVPLIATNVLGQDARGLGFLMSAVGVGAVFGALTLGSVVPCHPPRALLHASAAAGCAVLAALSIAEAFWLAAIGMFLLGYASVITGRMQHAASARLVRRAAGASHGPVHVDPRRFVLDRRSADRRRRRALERGRRALCWGAGGLAVLVVLMGAHRRRERRRSALAGAP